MMERGLNLDTHILYIEDNNSSLEFMKAVCSVDPNARLTTSVTGEEGLQILASNRFDVVITDIELPGMSGHEVLASIRETQPDIPVIALTAYSPQDFKMTNKDSVFTAVLTKPIDLNLFWETLFAVLDIE